jgi:uncharacterized membrane protein
MKSGSAGQKLRGEHYDIKTSFTSLQKLLIFAALACLLIDFLMISAYWSALPQKIPSHFGYAGKPDAWSGKESILILPLAYFTTCLIMIPLSFAPQSYNYLFSLTPENAARQYSLARSMMLLITAEIGAVFSYIVWTTVEVALNNSPGLGGLFIFLMLGLVFGTIGAYIWLAYKAR